MKHSFFAMMILLMVACEQGDSSTSTVTGGFADMPAGAVQTPYPDNEDLVQVEVSNASGDVLQQGDYLNGVREGVWTEFHPNGFVKSMTGYVNGAQQGQSIVIDDRGQAESTSFYHNGQMDGEYLKFNRTRIKEKRMYKNGKLNGLTEIFYADGKIMESSYYVDGLRDGVAKWYDQQGVVTIEYNYVKGEWIKDE